MIWKISHLFVGGKTGVRLWNDVYNNHSIKVISLNEDDSIKGDVI